MGNILKILENLVSINSVFPNERKLAGHTARILQRQGFNVQRHYIRKGRFNVLADNGKAGKAILFYAHLDTVPIYGDWKTNPLKVTKKGDKLYGLGVSDMKGGMAAILNNVANSDKHIKILLCSDEENISKGVWKTVRERKRWFKNVVVAISGEPGTAREAMTGNSNITIGRRGRTVISIDIGGHSAHGSTPSKGISALNEASKIALNLYKLHLKSAKGFGAGTAFVRELSSRSTSLSVPSSAHLEVDVHLVPGDSIIKIKREVGQLIRRLRREGILDRSARFEIAVKKRETPYIEPYVSDLKNENVKEVLKITRATLGEPNIRYGMSVADDNVLATQLKIPVLTIGPRGGNIHTSNEWASIRSLHDIDRLYAGLVKAEIV